MTRIFIHAPVRSPGSYTLLRRLATSPSKPLLLNRLHQHGESGIERTRIPDRLRQLRQDLLFEELAPFLEWLAHHVAAGEHHDVEHVVDDWSGRRTVVLEGVERGTAVIVERDDLAVDDRVVRHLRESLHDARISPAKVVVVTRPQMDDSVALERNRPIAVELQLVQPLLDYQAANPFAATALAR